MPRIFWLTGLPASGKSTLAWALKSALEIQGHPTVVLDGDALRRGAHADLGFSDHDRHINVTRTAHLAALLHAQGFFVVCALVSPGADQRREARRIAGEAYFEVYVDCSAEACARRDPKGLWARATSGKLDGFTGVQSTYEPPLSPDYHYRSDAESPDSTARAILKSLESAA